eukprot:TRINITY_DN8494_c0_g1_i1.p1 TRINITY_DN8494_c0_g1~~TRINITY_DN8494_c0_g1_i1.p1  ORF type:complete len:143 (+),score=4.35 TRINITY_DN8494_c0_g1_i1:721-1149(+)
MDDYAVMPKAIRDQPCKKMLNLSLMHFWNCVLQHGLRFDIRKSCCMPESSVRLSSGTDFPDVSRYGYLSTYPPDITDKYSGLSTEFQKQLDFEGSEIRIGWLKNSCTRSRRHEHRNNACGIPRHGPVKTRIQFAFENGRSLC